MAVGDPPRMTAAGGELSRGTIAGLRGNPGQAHGRDTSGGHSWILPFLVAARLPATSNLLCSLCPQAPENSAAADFAGSSPDRRVQRGLARPPRA